MNWVSDRHAMTWVESSLIYRIGGLVDTGYCYEDYGGVRKWHSWRLGEGTKHCCLRTRLEVLCLNCISSVTISVINGGSTHFWGSLYMSLSVSNVARMPSRALSAPRSGTQNKADLSEPLSLSPSLVIWPQSCYSTVSTHVRNYSRNICRPEW